MHTIHHRILENARYSTQAQCSAISINVELRPPDRDDVEGYYTGFMVPTEQVRIIQYNSYVMYYNCVNAIILEKLSHIDIIPSKDRE